MVAVTLRIAALWLLVACVPALAQGDARVAEVRIKAAFLYKFGEFVQWPPATLAGGEGAFTIGVVGADELASELERVVVDRTVHARPIAVRRLRRGDPLAGVHVLFVGQAESARLAEILAAAKGQAILTVTESDNGLSTGSMINFVPVEDKIRFDIALPPAERGQLKISARLLAVARRVVTG